MLSPLHDVSQVVQLIADVSETPPEQVRQRLRAEAAEIGTNVYQEMRQQQIPLYTASDQLDQFYQHSDAFLYETTVWNCCSAKQRMRDFVASRLQRLKPDGLLFVHAPFWCIHWTRSTHLKENQRFSGNLSHLYHAHGFQALDASLFWDPIVFQKSAHPQPLKAGLPAKLRIQLGRFLLTLGRRDGRVHTWIARQIARPPATWKTALQNLKEITE